MSELRSVLGVWQSEVLADLPEARIEDDFAELQRVGELIELERLRRLAELERRRTFERDGFLSVSAWLMSTHRLAPGAAHEQVRIARAMASMPRARRALEDGQISLSDVRVLASAQEAEPEAFARSEATLVQAARDHSVRQLQRVTAHWRRMAEAERGWGEEQVRERRGLQASVTFLGMVRLDGNLDPETGETFLAALNAVLDADARHRTDEDVRTPAQRRADALGEVCRQWLDRSDRPQVAGERPHMTVTVGIDDLRGGSGGAFDHTGLVGAATVARLACDASITRVVMSGRSEPMDVGRRTPVVSPALRRAVIARDRTCRFPGCERPASWCDVHHIVPWAQGGDTSLANSILLCRRHHWLVHPPGRFSLVLTDGRPVFRRPDGSVLGDGSGRAPP